MTLAEVLQRLRNPPSVGDQEIVRDRHGVSHVLVVVRSTVRRQNDLAALHGDLDFMCLCESDGNEYTLHQLQALEVAPVATCIRCLSR